MGILYLRSRVHRFESCRGRHPYLTGLPASPRSVSASARGRARRLALPTPVRAMRRPRSAAHRPPGRR